MKKLVVLTFIFLVFHLNAQKYEVKRNDSGITIELEGKIVSKYGVSTGQNLNANYRFDKNYILHWQQDTVATYIGNKLKLNGRTYKFKTPAFSLTNLIVDKTDGKTEVLRIFQENKDHFTLSDSFKDLSDQEKEVLTIWAIYKQSKDIFKKENQDGIDPVLMGFISGFFSAY